MPTFVVIPFFIVPFKRQPKTTTSLASPINNNIKTKPMSLRPRIPNHFTPLASASDPKRLQLNVSVSNGIRAEDAKLKFEFSPGKAGIARVWLVRLPALKNADAFPRRRAGGIWDLQLHAIGQTQPIQVLNYEPSCADQWLADAAKASRPAATDLLIICDRTQFTITVHQSISA